MDGRSADFKTPARTWRNYALVLLVLPGWCGGFTAADVGQGSDVAASSRRAAPGVAIHYTLPKDGLTSLAVYDAKGVLRRTLLSGAPQRAGAHSQTWDGLDRYGAALPPGTYTWKLLSHPGLQSHFITQVGANNTPSWQPPVGNWHAADAVAADASGVYLGSGETEGGMRSQKTDWNGKVIWQGGTGGQDGADDPFVWSMAATKERLYMLSAKREVWFRGADGSFVPRPALNVRFEGDKEGAKFEYQTDLAAADVTQGEAKGIEAIAVSYADHDAIRLYRRGTPGVDGDFVLLDTVPVKAPRSLDLRSDGSLIVLSEGRVLHIAGAKAEPKVLIKAEELDEPNRVRVDRASGDIFVTCGGKTQQVKRFSSDGTLLRSFGKKGGRNPVGVFDPTGLRGIADLAPDGKGGVVVAERTVAPRRVVHFEADGTVAHQWFGGTPFNTIGCPEPLHPRYVWYSTGYEITRAEVDYDKRTWKVLEIYPGFRTLARTMRAVSRGNLIYLLDAEGWGEIKVYDPQKKTLRPSVEVGEIKNLAAELQPPANADWRLYLWCDLNDDGEKSRDEMQAVAGWNGAMPQLLPDMTFMSASGTFFKPARFTPGGTPVYDNKQTVWFPAEVSIEGGKYPDPLHIAPGPGGVGWYRALQSTRKEPGHWDNYGIYFWNGKSGLNRIMRYDGKFNLLWEVGRHSTEWDHRPGTQSFPQGPVSAGDYVFVAEASDTEVPWYDVYDKDGLYVDDLPRRQADDLPEFAYAALLSGDNYGLNVWGNPKDGNILLFASGLWSAPIYRVTGWKDISRQSGKVTVPVTLPVAKGTGSGLTVEIFDNPNLEGEPKVTRTGEAYISYGKWDPIFDKAITAPVVSVRCKGQIEAPLSEDIHFFSSGSNNMKAWLGGQLATVGAPYRLTAGQRLDLAFEVRDLPNARGDGNKRVVLGWESASMEMQAIPSRFLYPPAKGGTVPNLKALYAPPNTLPTGKDGLIGSWPLHDGGGITGRNLKDFSRPALLHGAKWSRGDAGPSSLELAPGTYASIQANLAHEAQTVAFRFRTVSDNVTLYDAGRFFTFYNHFIDRSLKLDPNGLTAQAGDATIHADGKFNDDKWHQVVHSFNASGQFLYVDGKPQATGAGPVFHQTLPVTLRLAPENAVRAPVRMGDLRVYERAVGEAEIAEMAQP